MPTVNGKKFPYTSKGIKAAGKAKVMDRDQKREATATKKIAQMSKVYPKDDISHSSGWLK